MELLHWGNLQFEFHRLISFLLRNRIKPKLVDCSRKGSLSSCIRLASMVELRLSRDRCRRCIRNCMSVAKEGRMISSMELGKFQMLSGFHKLLPLIAGSESHLWPGAVSSSWSAEVLQNLPSSTASACVWQ